MNHISLQRGWRSETGGVHVGPDAETVRENLHRDRKYGIPNGSVSPRDIQPEADLSDADLSYAYLRNADLTDADLSNANLTNATLYGADLSGAGLTEANLRNCDMREATLADLTINIGTEIRNANPDIFENDIRTWDSVARSHHELKLACNENGLINKARRQHYLERRARGYELKKSISLNPWFTATWLGSFLSRVFIGYGVRVRRLLATMAVLFVGSTAVFLAYGVGGDAAIDTISYSVRAFTVAPPTAPEQFLPHVVMMIETFFGTLSIVLLGYVLSNREQF